MSTAKKTTSKGLAFPRRYTRDGVSPYELFSYELRTSVIRNPNGEKVFEMTDVEVPAHWSQIATDILAQKYFRKAGVPQPDGSTGRETSVKQVAHRMADCWRQWGEKYGYFASKADPQVFYDELVYSILSQSCAPNSPQWFNTGLHSAYGITGDAQGHYYVNPETGNLEKSKSAYERPQPHACFILSVDDDLVNDGGIMDLWVREARIFKYGSGVGTNYSNIRGEGEKLAGGGTSSGLMSFLKIGDRAAGAIKSGGTTRRAAKMVVLDLDHPEIEQFIDWKVEEEKKVAALIAAGYASDYEGEAYRTVSGQNSNNSVRIPNSFFKSLKEGGNWDMTARTDGRVMKTVPANALWDKIAYAAWRCADPGTQYDTTINEWHTCPEGGRIRASNPCSEYLFLDNTACNLASLNLRKFFDEETSHFDVEGFEYATRLWTVVLEISVLMAQFPSPEVAQLSYDYRTLGLGFANLGSMLMVSGIAYDSEEGRAIAGAITAIMNGISYKTSAEMAAALGAFPRYEDNKAHMLRVMRNHRAAAYDASEAYDNLETKPIGINATYCPDYLLTAATKAWDDCVQMGEKYGYRNAQATVIAPTGCLTGNSLVATQYGLVPLNTLGNTEGEQWQDKSFSVMTDEGEKEATKFYINGVAETRTIRTSAGYEIQGTLQHRIKVVDGATKEWVWKRFADISESDVVPMAMNTLFGEPREVKLPALGELYWASEWNTRAPRTMSADLAELVGYFMGDGSLHAKGLRFCVSKEDADVAMRIASLSKTLFNLDCHTEARGGYIEVAIHSVTLTQWWEACGFHKLSPGADHSGKGYLPRIPNAVLYTNDPACYTAFLRGLFEADSTVTNGVPCWSSVHKPFSDAVKQMLLALGIPTTTKHDISGWGQSTLYVVRLLNQSYNKAFAEKIGFIGARKHHAIRLSDSTQSARRDYIYLNDAVLEDALSMAGDQKNALQTAHRRHSAVTRSALQNIYEQTGNEDLGSALGYFYDKVESNTDGGEQLTYDISVPENVTYIANGFVSHNTIGLVMDCDTTGVEPDFALVKFKKLSGGGYMKIVNGSVPAALKKLGYGEQEIDTMVKYAKGHGTFAGAPYINYQTLSEKGLMAEELQKLDAAVESAFEVGFVFNVYTLGEECLKRLGFTAEQYYHPEFSLLEELGFSDDEIDAANDYVCGTMMMEGAPGLKPEHQSVFDTANKCGKKGERFIHAHGHIRMMAAVQPFISGAISKTINLPNEATEAEIKDCYQLSWELGIKACALYRDGSKLSQPLSNKSDKKKKETSSSASESEEKEAEATEMAASKAENTSVHHENTNNLSGGCADLTTEELLDEVNRRVQASPDTKLRSKLATIVERKQLPAKRRGYTMKGKVGGQALFLRTGEYGDGTLGEIFIDMAKEGATMRSLLNSFAIAVSVGLQYGVPLDEYVDKFIFTRFEPAGIVDHPNIKNATSVLDYIFRVLAYEYLDRDDLVHVPDLTRHAHKAVEGNLRDLEDSGMAMPKVQEGSAQNALNPTAPVLETIATPGTRHHAGSMAEAKADQKKLMGTSADAPACKQCGNITLRNGTCYMCPNCGTTTGCS